MTYRQCIRPLETIPLSKHINTYSVYCDILWAPPVDNTTGQYSVKCDIKCIGPPWDNTTSQPHQDILYYGIQILLPHTSFMADCPQSCSPLHCSQLFYTELNCTALHCTALHCTALLCSALLYTALLLTVLDFSTQLGTALHILLGILVHCSLCALLHWYVWASSASLGRLSFTIHHHLPYAT